MTKKKALEPTSLQEYEELLRLHKKLDYLDELANAYFATLFYIDEIKEIKGESNYHRSIDRYFNNAGIKSVTSEGIVFHSMEPKEWDEGDALYEKTLPLEAVLNPDKVLKEYKEIKSKYEIALNERRLKNERATYERLKVYFHNEI